MTRRAIQADPGAPATKTATKTAGKTAARRPADRSQLPA
jgi:hypothetical protein